LPKIVVTDFRTAQHRSRRNLVISSRIRGGSICGRLAVIEQALIDRQLCANYGHSRDRDQGSQFDLTGNPLLFHWMLFDQLRGSDEAVAGRFAPMLISG
jgi:hypothetical protein